MQAPCPCLFPVPFFPSFLEDKQKQIAQEILTKVTCLPSYPHVLLAISTIYVLTKRSMKNNVLY